ncbi:MAG: phage antirepressor KilAC domain-containing protein [Selenomonadaceae bacterium]|nr:phage antirepressor KilAC domain-containing protein [Selenomonadaceae bacterium]
MTEIITIQNVRAYLDANNTAWLNAADVARGLGFTETKNGVEYIRWRTINGYLKGLGFSQEVAKDSFIPENMFYRLAMKANNETAQIFQAKVADEILPAIRKRGVYATDDFIERTLANPDFAIRVFTQLKEEREKNALLTEQNALLSEHNTILQPKADYCDAVLDSDELLDITDIAKEYGFSGQTFNRIIADFGIQYRKGNTWALRQEYTGKDYARLKTSRLSGRTVTYLAWTQRGRYFLYHFLKEHGLVPVHERLAKGA